MTVGTRPLVIVGPTAVGKSGLALELATTSGDFELLSIDSMQVYRGMDIGTAKPSAAEQSLVRHHLIDLIDPHETMDIVDFATAYDTAIETVSANGHTPLLVGGTGLYLRAVLDGLTPPPRFEEVAADLESEPHTPTLHGRLQQLDPLAASRIDPNNRRRVIRALEVCLGSGRPFSSFGPGMEQYPAVDATFVGIDADRSIIDERIDARYDVQMEMGFLDEVHSLLSAELPLSHTAAQALGYKELAQHIRDERPLDEALEEAKRRTRRFARRQQRWFRRDPRITWLEHRGDPEQLLESLAHVWDSSG